MQDDASTITEEASIRWPEDCGLFLAALLLIAFTGYATGVLAGMLNFYVTIIVGFLAYPAFQQARDEFRVWKARRGMDRELEELSLVRD